LLSFGLQFRAHPHGAVDEGGTLFKGEIGEVLAITVDRPDYLLTAGFHHRIDYQVDGGIAEACHHQRQLLAHLGNHGIKPH